MSSNKARLLKKPKGFKTAKEIQDDFEENMTWVDRLQSFVNGLIMDKRIFGNE